MNFFCRIFGHTWSPVADNPKITWSTTDDMLVLTGRASTEDVRFYDVCLRCRERREVQVKRRPVAKSNAAASNAAASSNK